MEGKERMGRRRHNSALLTPDVPLHYGVLYCTYRAKKSGGSSTKRRTFWVRVNCLLRVGRGKCEKSPFFQAKKASKMRNRAAGQTHCYIALRMESEGARTFQRCPGKKFLKKILCQPRSTITVVNSFFLTL